MTPRQVAPTEIVDAQLESNPTVHLGVVRKQHGRSRPFILLRLRLKNAAVQNSTVRTKQFFDPYDLDTNFGRQLSVCLNPRRRIRNKCALPL
jgi:hypothetical protein